MKNEFFNAPQTRAPKIRWWLPGAAVTSGELRQEVQMMKAGGFSGAEICPFMPGYVSDRIDWGSKAWYQTLKTILHSARDNCFTIDLTLTPGWPLALPTINNVDDPQSGALLELDGAWQDGISQEHPFTAPLPESVEAKQDASRAGGQVTLLAVTTARYVDKEQHILALSSARRLPLPQENSTGSSADKATGSTPVYSFCPDQAGEYVLFAWYVHAAGEQTYGYNQVDHFGLAGTRKLIDYYETQVFPALDLNSSPDLEDLFIDSLEFHSHLDYTPRMFEIFAAQHHFDFIPYLPSVYDQDCPGGCEGRPAPDFQFDQDHQAIQNTYYEFLTDLYIQNHLEPLMKLCQRHGLALRYQTAYGKVLELARTAACVSIPETETLYGDDILDFYRVQSGPVHLAHQPVYSIEAAAEWNGRDHAGVNSGNYQQTFDNMLWHTQRAFAAYVNQIVFHGYAYRGQTATGTLPGLAWPGFDAFGADGPSNTWGERQPNWSAMPRLTSFLARNQWVLQQGEAKVDLAVYRHSYHETIDFNGTQRLFVADRLEARGYNYEFIGPAALRDAKLSGDGTRLFPDGPAYKALVINNTDCLPADSVTKLQELARQGFPIIFWRQIPRRRAFYEDPDITAALTDLLSQPSVCFCADEAALIQYISQLGLRPEVAYAQPASFWAVHRDAGSVDYYYLYNHAGAQSYLELKAQELAAQATGTAGDPLAGQQLSTRTITLSGDKRGKPYELDAWTGTVRPLPYRLDPAGRLELTLSLKANDSILIAVLTEHSTESDLPFGDCLVSRDGSQAFPAEALTKQSAWLRHESILLPAWTLDLETWAKGSDALEIRKARAHFAVSEPCFWTRFKEGQGQAGIGTYRTAFELTPVKASHYWLELRGEVRDALILYVNEQPVALNQVCRLVDVTQYLCQGRNVITCQVSSTLLNAVINCRLDAADPRGRDPRAYEDFGMEGPVCLHRVWSENQAAVNFMPLAMHALLPILAN
ncbi:hypothetical protein HCH52_10745 [Oscillospiraceae bacterium HV4-5-C5C]|nr:hypothetical protein [Oscillospiraceae bacterium HV4-5-C5C]